MFDLFTDDNGDFIRNDLDIQFTSNDADYLISRLKIKFKTFYGEYFLDNTMGLPYIPTPNVLGSVSIFGKNPNMDTISALYKAQITAEPLVQSITSFLMQYDAEVKQLQINFAVKLVNGAVLPVSIIAP